MFQIIYQRDTSPASWKETEERAKAGLNLRGVNRIKHAWATAAIMVFEKAGKKLYKTFGANVEDKYGNKDAYIVYLGERK